MMKKKAGGGTQPKEDKMKKLVLANTVSKPRGLLNTAKYVFCDQKGSIFTPAAESHGLWPWMHAPTFGRDVAPLGH